MNTNQPRKTMALWLGHVAALNGGSCHGPRACTIRAHHCLARGSRPNIRTGKLKNKNKNKIKGRIENHIKIK
jgi:hypothetical protein